MSALLSRSTLISGACVPARQPVACRPSLGQRLPAQRLKPCAATDTQLNSSTPSTSKSSKPAVEYIPDTEFAISKVSFGSILTPVGSFLLLYGFGAYFGLAPGADLSSVMLVYGFPLAILGFALNYAQLEPAPCKTTKEAFDLRASQCTDIQKQIREDCTRYRYGDEQHLEEALDRIFRYNKAGGIARKFAPVLIGLREEVEDGAYTLVLEFSSKLEPEKWQERQGKFQSFFGPGITARVEMTEVGADVYLICDGSGAGRGGGEKKDPLMPLLPGLKPRQQ